MFPLRDYNPNRGTPYVTWGLLALNVMVFAFQLTRLAGGGNEAFATLVAQLGLIPDRLLSPGAWAEARIPAPLTLVTSMFVHGDLFHLGGNMLYLWVFADNVEHSMGHGRFLAFYLLSGLAAAGLQIAVMPESTLPMVGASGAIAGVLGAYLVLFPGARVLTLVFIVVFARVMVLPAALLLGIWFALQLWSALAGDGPGVAWYAHIGGFVAGVAMVPLLSRRRVGMPWGRR